MPNDAIQVLVGLALLIVLAITLGTLAARLFMSSTRDPRDVTKP